MYKGKEYEYDKAGLKEYHAAKEKKKKIKRAKDVQMQNLNLSPVEKKEKEKLEKLKGPLKK
tara:strand:- start:605 stop:787 length:183 start_codon:yes stop_codon:yes gene_type:complete